jgi:predicted ArsR family transcriptional regulator
MSTPAADFRNSDAAVVDLLRGDSSLGIGDLAGRLGVTATAVRQRLDRLMRAGLVERRTVAKPRGRPAHSYSLTASGRRLGGDNFRDLAMVLWREVRRVTNHDVRRGLLGRIAGGLAEACRGRVTGETASERFAGVAALFAERNIACAVQDGALPVLTTYSCPYPDLADEDRAICAAERLMIQELVGTAVQLSECRLDGAACCRFTAVDAPPAGGGVTSLDEPCGLERTSVPSSNAGGFPVHPPAPESLP